MHHDTRRKAEHYLLPQQRGERRQSELQQHAHQRKYSRGWPRRWRNPLFRYTGHLIAVDRRGGDRWPHRFDGLFLKLLHFANRDTTVCPPKGTGRTVDPNKFQIPLGHGWARCNKFSNQLNALKYLSTPFDMERIIYSSHCHRNQCRDARVRQ